MLRVTAGASVRAATLADAAAIAAIYNEGIRGRASTFETRERTALEVEGWFGSRPLLVAERAALVVGWAAASEYRARACYDGVGDFSVYVAARARGQAVGSALLAALLPACAAAGLWKLVSRVFPENAASRALCARHGFREVGVYRRHARLDGVFRDVVIVERGLEP